MVSNLICLLFIAISLVVCFVWLFRKSTIFVKIQMRVIAILLIVLVSFAISFIPFDTMLISFNSPEEAYAYINWRNKEKNVNAIIEGEDSALVVGNEGGADSWAFVKKENGVWKVEKIAEERVYFDVVNGISIFVYRYKDTNDYYLYLFNDDDAALNLSDSDNSEFIVTSHEYPYGNQIDYSYYTHLTGMDENYWINANGTVIYPFQND